MITINPNFPGFKHFFKNLLTIYQREADTYKDVNKEGLFERYMAIFGEHIDNEFSSQIENYLDVIDANVCEEKFLTHLSDVLGNPPDIFKNVEQYRNMLSYIVSVYKVKGTTKGYKLFFYIFGFDVTIIETELIAVSNIYDDGNTYDDTKIYEPDTCARCSTYTISIKQIIDNGFIIDSTTLALLRDAITFNQPINAILSNFTIVTNFEDNLGSISLDDTQTSGIHSTDVTLQLDTISNITIAEEIITTLNQTSNLPTIGILWDDVSNTVDKVCNLAGCPYTIGINYADADSDISTVRIEQSTDSGATWFTVVTNTLTTDTPNLYQLIIHPDRDNYYRAVVVDSLGHSTTSNVLRAYSTYVPPPVVELVIESSQTQAGLGTLNLYNGEPNEIITLYFYVEAGAEFISLELDPPVTVASLDPLHLTRTGSIQLDNTGAATSGYMFTPSDGNSICIITVTGRSSAEPIPPITSTSI